MNFHISITNLVIHFVFFFQQLFQRLQDSQPDFREKIVPIKADLLQPRLGLSTEDILRLQAEVSIVFHVAATIKFNEVLK